MALLLLCSEKEVPRKYRKKTLLSTTISGQSLDEKSFEEYLSSGLKMLLEAPAQAAMDQGGEGTVRIFQPDIEMVAAIAETDRRPGREDRNIE